MKPEIKNSNKCLIYNYFVAVSSASVHQPNLKGANFHSWEKEDLDWIRKESGRAKLSKALR